jgi:hypothetical protein
MSLSSRAFRCAAVASAALACGVVVQRASAAQFNNFPEFGTTVNGYQDDFGGTTLDAGWNEVGGDGATNFTLNGAGILNLLPAMGDPNKLLYNAAYDVDDQNILALIRVTDPNPPANNGLWRGGVATASSPAAMGGQGINALFKTPGSEGPGNHVQFLNDQIAWGAQIPDGDFQWQVGQWYWLRLTHEGDNDARISVWLADNATPESAGDSVSVTNFGDRDGLAGLVTNSGASGTFEVDYVLIQAEGLPSILVPEPASLGLLALGTLGLLGRRRRQA